MRINHESSLTPRWIVFGTALVYFALGSVLTAHFMHLKEAWADSHRVFQLKIHHAVPGKMPLLEERFCRASRLQARHGLAAAKTRWDAFHADSAFWEYVQSENSWTFLERHAEPSCAWTTNFAAKILQPTPTYFAYKKQ